MNSLPILARRLEDLRRDLNRARLALDNTKDKNLQLRAKDRFGDEFDARFGEAKELEALVSLPSAPPSLKVAEYWAKYRTLNTQIGVLIAECLAFRVGELLRREKLDDQLCEIADALLDALSDDARISWKRLTILDRTDQYVPLAQIIRFRFPTSVWDLPLVAHEYGHFLASELKEPTATGQDRFPFTELLAREGNDPLRPEARNHLRELFSDVFAAYALGPAYAFPSVLRRYDPSENTVGTYTHPSGDARVRAILRVLKKTDEARPAGGGHYESVIHTLQNAWNNCRKDVLPEPKETAEYLSQLECWVDEIYLMIANNLKRVRFDDWGVALQIAPMLAPEGRDALPAGAKIPAVLNAAWSYHNEHPDATHEELTAVSIKAVAMIREIMKRSSDA